MPFAATKDRIEGWLRRWHGQVAAALVAVHVALAWHSRALTPGLWRDEAQYILLARSLRDFRYQDYFLIGSPTHSQYPPGFPALLAIVSLPFGDLPVLLIATVTICSMTALALMYDLVRRCAGHIQALLVLALCAANPELILHAGRVLSEAPYMLWSTVGLWAMARESLQPEAVDARPGRWPRIAGIAAVLAALTRMVGVTMLGAVWLMWLIERRYRRVLVLTALGAATVGGYLAWTIVAPDKLVGRSYIADATFSKLERPSFTEVLFDRVTKNGLLYLTEYLEKDLPQPTLAAVAKRVNATSPRARSTVAAADDVVLVIAFTVLAAFGVLDLRKRAPHVVVYLGAYALLMLVWPWSLARFLVPVLPLLLWLLVAGAARLSSQRRWLHPLPFVVAGAILAMASARDLNVLRDNLRCDRSRPESDGCATDVERGYLAAMRFARQFTPDSAVFLTTADAQLGYFADRRALFTKQTGAADAPALLAYMRTHGVEYAVLTPIRPPEDQLLPWLRQICHELEVVKEFPAVTLLLRAAPANAPPRVNACADVQRYETSAIRSSLW